MQNESEPEKSRLDIVSDEDWKDRIKAEDAALEAKLKAEQNPQHSQTSEQAQEKDSETSRREQAERSQKIDASQLPPANLTLLISMFSTQAMSAMGLFPNPVTGKIDMQLALAKHYIDLLAVLEQKTKGNLTPDEAQLLDNSLHELRMVYIQQSKVTV